GVHLVRHRGRADLAGHEPLGGELGPGHEPDGERGGGGAGDGLDERGADLVVERARVDLADRVHDPLEPEVGGDAGLELGEFRGVAVEEVEPVAERAAGLGAGGG
ncbi:hypothetical protein ADL26_20585, partial [Thermoactinomyces vulgaris]